MLPNIKMQVSIANLFFFFGGGALAPLGFPIRKLMQVPIATSPKKMMEIISQNHHGAVQFEQRGLIGPHSLLLQYVAARQSIPLGARDIILVNGR